MRNVHTGDVENDNFNVLLNKFDEAKKEKDWRALIDEAKQREPLTGRQREAIVARCENQINGTYGNTKAHIQQSAYDQQRAAGKPAKTN